MPRLTKKLEEHYHRVFVRAINKAKKNGWYDERWPYCDLPFEFDCCLSYIELAEDKSFRSSLPESYLERLDKIIETDGVQLEEKREKWQDKLFGDETPQ